MKKLNRKGFTLVEALAIVVILGMLLTIMIPNVNNLIKINQENNKKQLIESIKSAAKLYISDYKYKITIEGSCSNENDTLLINKINTTTLTESKLPIKILVDEGTIKTSKNGNIYNPTAKDEKLNLNNSYIVIKYSCKTKNYKYEEPHIEWINS